MTFVPYQGSAPAATALMGQHVTSGIRRLRRGGGADQERQAASAGQGTAKRTDLLPDLPTFNELRLQESRSRQLVRRHRAGRHAEGDRGELIGWFRAAMNDSEMKSKVAAQGLYMVGTCGDAFGALIRKRYDEYGQAIAIRFGQQ